ncbi:MAG: hypothetical protein OJF47_002982 [Nitrospira sp.]|nr:MAG: hypothetical protein OJF47_002982 [Nitrospira sp.]
MIHEPFCCNRRLAATTGLRPVGSPLTPSPYCTRTPRVLRAPRAGLATRLSDFATNRHESCGLSLSTLSCKQLGWPFGSVMLYGLDEQGPPSVLLSSMAIHMQNLLGDSRAGLLITPLESQRDA